jgi:hypothetical protein
LSLQAKRRQLPENEQNNADPLQSAQEVMTLLRLTTPASGRAPCVAHARRVPQLAGQFIGAG